jgi:hypothetical protein
MSKAEDSIVVMKVLILRIVQNYRIFSNLIRTQI